VMHVHDNDGEEMHQLSKTKSAGQVPVADHV
jgi:hypothetical protein